MSIENHSFPEIFLCIWDLGINGLTWKSFSQAISIMYIKNLFAKAINKMKQIYVDSWHTLVAGRDVVGHVNLKSGRRQGRTTP